jgi:hypothetical protein
MVFEVMVLRRIFGPKREEVAGGWRRPHNEELHNLHDSPNTHTKFWLESPKGLRSPRRR